MKLYMWPTSPYVAKTLAVAEYKQLKSQIELVYVHPWQKDSFIPADNPLGKIPTLITDTGEALYDSSVICEYLDSIGQGSSSLFPEGEGRWQALKLQALANGMMDAGVSVQYELRFRPQDKQSQDWAERQLKAIGRSLVIADEWAAQYNGTDSIASIAIGMAVAYLQLRMPELDDWGQYPQLLSWLDGYIQKPFMHNNRPSLKDLPTNMETLVA